jgi:uncharacterized protein YaiE (UPF0345 family)
MLKVNEYFNGKVKSIGCSSVEQRATVGVMAPGDYQFSTAAAETMKVVFGEMTIKRASDADWQTFGTGTEYYVEANSEFSLRIAVDTAYLCLYHD